MKIVKNLFGMCLLINVAGFAQESKTIPPIHKENNSNQQKSTSHLEAQIIRDIDSIQLRDFKIKQEVDSIWLAELMNSDLYPKIIKAVLDIPYNTDVVDLGDVQELSTQQIQSNLKVLNRQSGFHFAY